MNLTDLAKKYGSDKLHCHSYIPFYAALFSNMKVRRLLEIGIGYEELMAPFVPFYVHGSSLLMWQEYFPEAEIYSCDHLPEILINEGRIHSWVCDEAKPGAMLDLVVNKIGGNLDVAIHDGSHVTEYQVASVRALLPFLSPGGVCVIEDVQDPVRVVSELGEGRVFMFGNRSDDNLVLLRR